MGARIGELKDQKLCQKYSVLNKSRKLRFGLSEQLCASLHVWKQKSCLSCPGAAAAASSLQNIATALALLKLDWNFKDTA